MEIRYIGLHKTLPNTLNKVLQIDVHQSEINIDDTTLFFTSAAKTLYNTKLFSQVSYRFVVENETDIRLTFVLKERWYTHGLPYIGIIDRNFNEWWVTRGHRLDRLIIGADITQRNLSGRNDDLSISMLTGFQQRAEIKYALPQYLKDGKIGFTTNFTYNKYRSVNYNTIKNQLYYIKTEKQQFQRIAFDLGLTYNFNFNRKFWVNIGYFNDKIGDELLEANPDFLFKNVHKISFTQVKIGGKIDNRNIRGYAQKGSLYWLELKQVSFINKLSMSYWQLDMRWTRHLPLGQKADLALSTIAKLSKNKERPYMQNRAIGWDINTLRNYDYYSIEGNSYVIQKASIRYRLVDEVYSNAKIPINQFKILPFKIVSKAYLDFGYANNTKYIEQGNFANRPLFGYGIGLDLVFFDDAVWRLEYGFNHLGQSALYINFTSAIQ